MADPINITLQSPHDTFGITGMTLVSCTKGWRASIGKTFNYVYEGPVSAAESFYTSYTGDSSVFDEVTMDLNNGMARITLVVAQDVSTTNVPDLEKSTTWEVIPNEIIKPIESSWRFDGVKQSIIDRAKSLAINPASYWDENSPNYKIDVNTFTQSGETIYTEGDKKAARSLYYMYTSGVSEYYDISFIIRSSIDVSGGSTTLKCSWNNVGEAQSFGDLNISGAYQSAILGAISNIPGYTGNSQFLKRAPSLTNIGRNKWRINQEWIWAVKWSKVLYNGTWNDIDVTNKPPAIQS